MSKIYDKDKPLVGRDKFLPPPPGRPIKNNDNPVPSLDNLILKLRCIRNGDQSIPIKVYNDLTDLENDFLKLQNGVETDKEQPRYKEDDYLG